jgi:hypothetical protein
VRLARLSRALNQSVDQRSRWRRVLPAADDLNVAPAVPLRPEVGRGPGAIASEAVLRNCLGRAPAQTSTAHTTSRALAAASRHKQRCTEPPPQAPEGSGSDRRCTRRWFR